MLTNDKIQREQYIEQNLPLVHSLAHRYTGRGVEYDDLFAAGSLGLVKAYDGFDESKGFSFSTYAVPVILGEIRRLFRDGGAVKVSRSLKELALSINRERAKLESELNREPTLSELSRRLNVPPEEIAAASDAALPPVSLTGSDDDGNKVADIPDGSNEERLIDKIALSQALDGLSDRDKELIRLRYFCDMTQAKTAKLLGMTQVSVSRQEKALLGTLRQNLQ